MMGMDKEIDHLQNEMEIAEFTGLCLGLYNKHFCAKCDTEAACMKYFIKEKKYNDNN